MSEPYQPSLGSREERIAYNEAWCRELNERKAKSREGAEAAAGFRCECWQVDCEERIPLSGGEWEEARSEPNYFAVAPGHVAEDLEVVVKEYPHFWLVQKHGEAGEIAEKLT